MKIRLHAGPEIFPDTFFDVHVPARGLMRRGTLAHEAIRRKQKPGLQHFQLVGLGAQGNLVGSIVHVTVSQLNLFSSPLQEKYLRLCYQPRIGRIYFRNPELQTLRKFPGKITISPIEESNLLKSGKTNVRNWKDVKFIPLALALLHSQIEAGSFPGITEPLKQSTISAVVPGRITVIHFKEGMNVTKGAIILELEKEEEEIEVARRKLILDSKTELQSAEQQLETLKRDYEATRKVFETTQSVSEEEVWKKDLDHKMAKSELERLRMGEAREELEYRIAQTKLRQRLIAAPFDGVVVKLHLQAGESCKAQEPLVKVVNTSKCRFITYMDAASSLGLAVGGKVDLRLGSRSAAVILPGVLDFVAPVVDPSSGLREVKVVFQNPEGKVQPGVSGTMVVADKQ